MNNTESHFAIREWRRHLLHPLTLTALISVSVILCLVGPFGTTETLPLAKRAMYWTVLTFSGYTAGHLFSYALLRSARPNLSHLTRVALAGVLTGLTMSALVTGLNLIVFDVLPSFSSLPVFVGTIVVISMIITGLVDLFSRHFGQPTQTAEQNPKKAAILDRLSLDKRGAVVALSVEDHYVRVRTVNGEEMILMRLADAMREVNEIDGAQVHRSHWAAFDHVQSVTRQPARATLHMSHGPDIPVSRANLPKLKEAGLLP